MPRSKNNPSESQEKNKAEAVFPIVAIGTSAGGSEELEAFSDVMPPKKGTAFAITQHIATRGKIIPGDILRKHTHMKILDVQDGMGAKPDHVYLNPPGKNVVRLQCVFHLEELVEVPWLKVPMDHS